MRPLKIPKEQRELLVEQVMEYFEVERGEPIGHLAAESVLDFSRRPSAPIYTTRRSAIAGLW